MWQCTWSTEKLWSVIKHPSKATTASFLCCTAHQEQRQQLYSRSSPSKTAPRKLQPFVDQENFKKSKKNKIKKKGEKSTQIYSCRTAVGKSITKAQSSGTTASSLWKRDNILFSSSSSRMHLMHPPAALQGFFVTALLSALYSPCFILHRMDPEYFQQGRGEASQILKALGAHILSSMFHHDSAETLQPRGGGEAPACPWPARRWPQGHQNA